MKRALIAVLIAILAMPFLAANGARASPVFMSDLQILRFTDDFGSDLWTPYPADGVFWDKVWGNDGNESYMQSPTSPLPQTFTSISDWVDPGWSGERIYVGNWAIALSVGTSTSSFRVTLAVTGFVSTFYNFNTVTPAYSNATYTYGQTCPVTKTAWNDSIIDDMYFTFTRTGGNATRITDFGILVQTTAWSVDVASVDYFDAWAGISLTSIIGFGTLGAGFFHPEFTLISGLVWIYGGIMYFTAINIGFMLLTVGIGFVLMMRGAMVYLDKRNESSGVHY